MSDFLKNDSKNNNTLDKEIDLKEILLILTRKKIFISYFATVGFILGCILALFSERIWKGEFQIVLNKENDRNSSNVLLRSIENSDFGNKINSFSLFNNTSVNLKTEVEILQSPSVLIDIFEFVKDRKSPKFKKNEDFRFKDWRKSLDIKLVKGTTILDIAYTDNDKELIEDVLNKLSLKYQSYAGEKRLKQVKLGIKYFEDQIDFYSKKSIDSFKKAQKFAIDQDLFILFDQNSSNQLNNPGDIERIRVESANEIRFLNERILNLRNSKNKDSNIISQALELEEFTNSNEENLLKKLIKIDNNLASLRVVYKENDISIKSELKKRAYLLEALKKQLIDIYEAKKLNAQAKLIALKRPKEILIKYSQLLSDSYKDRNILESLDNQYRALLLDKARNLEPWDLITKPTLLPYPVGTPRRLIALYGLIGGLLVGSFYVLFMALKNNKISSVSEIEKLVDYPIISQLSIRHRDQWSEVFEFIASSLTLNTKGSLGILIIDETNPFMEESIKNYLQKFLKDRKKIITNNIMQVLDFDNIIFLVTLNSSKRESFIDLTKKLKIQNKYIFGSIIIKY